MNHGFLVPLVLLLSVRLAPQEPLAPASPKPYVLNARIDGDLTVTDLDGASHALFAENPEKALVLVFWTYRDPVSRSYVKTLTELQRVHADKLTLVLVESNYDALVTGVDPLVKMRTVLEAEKVTLPVRLDRGNKLADDFRAMTNGEVFLLDSNHFLRYRGGIDDDPTGERKKRGIEPQAWLQTAIDQVLVGERPKENWTVPTGRPIKRTPEDAPAPTPAPTGSKKK